jgi:hypothetical protein
MRRSRIVLFALASAPATAAIGLAVGSAVAAPVAVAVDAQPALDAMATMATMDDAALQAASRAARIPPDPSPLTERVQWVFDLRWDKGEVYLVQVESRDMREPRVTPRVFGRFALELFEGPTLMERVRFDFPMLGGNADLEDAGAGAVRPPVRLTARLRTRIGVLFPATSRGTRLELWDRATDERYALPWPPKVGIAEPPPRPPLVPETWDVISAKDAGVRARPAPKR